MPDLTPAQRRELGQTAEVFEMITEANPADVSALEALAEIYVKLGEREKLASVTARLVRARRNPTAATATATAPSPAPAPPTPAPTAVRTASPASKVPAKPPVKPVAVRSEPRARLMPLGDLLVAGGLITRDQLAQALRKQKGSTEKLGSILVRMHFINEDQLAGFLSQQYGVPSITLSSVNVESSVIQLLPGGIARRYDLLPIQRDGDSLTVAMADPVNVHAIDHVTFITGLRVLPVVAAQGAIREAIEKYYDSGAGSMAEAMNTISSDLEGVEVVGDDDGTTIDVFELKESADEAPVVKLVNMVLVDAIQKGASDIHWEPYEKVFRIRFRIDGVLHEMLSPPKRLEAAITSRIQVMASLDIAERRLPQDGRIKLRYNRREIDFRVSVLPTIFGEKAVLRILDKESLKLDLTELGFDQWSLNQFQAAIRQPYGMVLITGPTGSGKTTTLYSAIHTLNAPDVNIVTAEDPVEYNLKGVNQVQVNEGIGRTFAAALRSFLRQDPDVILVGETRDVETAQISIRAALTGHLVFTTLHTNDCPSTIARLLEMGIQPFLLSSSLLLILAQRLARRLCAACKEPYEVDEESLAPYGHVPTGRGKVTIHKSQGCPTCSFTGMKGRGAIYEGRPVNQGLKDAILRSATIAAIREIAQSQGMKTLRQAALLKVLAGTTSIEEVLRVTLA